MLQKGKFYRRAQPWTVSNNWIGDSKPPYRLLPDCTFAWNGQVLRCPPTTVSDPYTLDLKTFTFRWKIAFSVGVFNFGLGCALQAIEETPNNLIELTLIDDFGSALFATWVIEPDTYQWNWVEFKLGPPTTVKPQGFFGASPLEFGPFVVPYFMEP